MCQLDDRYFTDLKGQYEFTLNFLVKSSETKKTICAVRPVHQWDRRSVNCEVELEPGTYEIIPKIMAERSMWRPRVEKMVKRAADQNPKKLRQIGLQYDLAHAKGGIVDEDEALRKKRDAKKKKKIKGKKQEEKNKQMAEAMAQMEQAMVAMRHEYNQTLKEKEKEKEKEKDKGKDKKESTLEPKSDDDSDFKGSSDVETKSDKVLPGCWPEESGKNNVDASKRCETSVEPRKEPFTEDKDKRRPSPSGPRRGGPPSPPSGLPIHYQDQVQYPDYRPPFQNNRRMTMTDYSMDQYPVFTPPTEPTSESDQDNSSSGSGSGSDTVSDDNSSSSDSDDIGFPTTRRFRLGQRKKQPWNAVCVIGLRVYAQHEGIKVRLADQKRNEATELVAPEGSSAAGPTE